MLIFATPDSSMMVSMPTARTPWEQKSRYEVLRIRSRAGSARAAIAVAIAAL